MLLQFHMCLITLCQKLVQLFPRDGVFQIQMRVMLLMCSAYTASSLTANRHFFKGSKLVFQTFEVLCHYTRYVSITKQMNGLV
jgi:hypothetical protein